MMLNKSILLNLRIAKSDMSTLLGLTVTALVLLMAGMGGMFFLSLFIIPVILICYIIFDIRISNKIFFHSFFDDEGTMYMTLPIPARDVVLGKVLAVAGYMTLMQALLIMGMLAIIVVFKGSNYDLLTTLTRDITLLEGSPAEVAVVFGMYPVSTFISCLFSSAFLLAIFLKVGMKKKNLLFCWAVYGVVWGILNSGLEQIGKQFGELTFGSAIDALVHSVIYLAAALFLIRYSIRVLEEKYNV